MAHYRYALAGYPDQRRTRIRCEADPLISSGPVVAGGMDVAFRPQYQLIDISLTDSHSRYLGSNTGFPNESSD